MTGPLAGLRVLEVAAIGPAPFAVMAMADMGAEVIRVDRPLTADAEASVPYMGRGRRSIAVNLREEAGVEVFMGLVEWADVLVEGMRPGVTERLGVGPEECAERNPRLVYGRMTGWGQEGPLAGTAGHDINYISISGALGAIGPRSTPVPPLNLVGDFGGGAMLLLVGILMALQERHSSGRGQVVDAAMVDGSSLLMTLMHEFLARGEWTDARESNLLDGGAPYYAVYETADGGHVAVGALEPQFFKELIARLEIDFDPAEQEDRDAWPRLRRLLAETFARRSRQEWERRFADSDACVSPVLSVAEAGDHPHARARNSFVGPGRRPAAAPRFSRTPGSASPISVLPGTDSRAVLEMLGFAADTVERLVETGVVGEENHRARGR
jgi:alpha-methylacyl-CoA racemase